MLPVSDFVAKFLPEAEKRMEALQAVALTGSDEKETVLLIPDFTDSFPLYPKILNAYFSEDHPDQELLIYLPEQDSTPEHLEILDGIFQKYADRDCNVIVQSGESINEHILFQCADYYITTRSRETVFRTCLADLYQTKILYGTDEPIFHT